MQARTYQFDAQDRPQKLQGPFVLHKTWNPIDHNPTVIMELGGEFSGNLAEPLLNHAELWGKDELRRLARAVADLNELILYGMELHRDDLGRRCEGEDTHRLVGALRQIL